MSTNRLIWVLWCLAWTAFWFFLGFVTLITWLFVPFALLAILMPVGKQRRPKQPLRQWDTRNVKTSGK